MCLAPTLASRNLVQKLDWKTSAKLVEPDFHKRSRQRELEILFLESRDAQFIQFATSFGTANLR